MSAGQPSSVAAEFLVPQWPAPANVRAYTTLRHAGASLGPYASFNLAEHVGDAPTAVSANRRQLQAALSLPSEPCWLQQVHGTTVICCNTEQRNERADAAWAAETDRVCAVLTADCLPLLVCDRPGTCVAAIHAGWRGLADGIIEHCIRVLPAAARDLLVWLGPAIGPTRFEVGEDVYRCFVSHAREAKQAFRPSNNDRWLADLYLLARQRLAAVGVSRVYGGQWCTSTDEDRFYSYRRDGRTGRMASLIWRT